MATMGSLPPTTVYNTWLENVEVWSVDDDTLYDLSSVVEITIKLRNRYTRFDELILTKSHGDVTLPSPGVIQWRAEAGLMGTLQAITYEAIILLNDGTSTEVLMLGPLSVVE